MWVSPLKSVPELSLLEPTPNTSTTAQTANFKYFPLWPKTNTDACNPDLLFFTGSLTITNSMGQWIFLEKFNRHATSNEIPHIMQHVQNSPALACILSQTNQVHILTSHFYDPFQWYCAIYASDFFPSGFPAKILYVFLTSTMHATHTTTTLH